MKLRLLAGAACAALTVLAAPAMAATSPELPSPAIAIGNPAVGAFYAARSGSPLWLKNGDSAAARELIGVLQRAELDGLRNGPALAAQAQALMARAQSGDPAAVTAADRFLSNAFVAYVSALQTPPAGITYGDPSAMPKRESAGQILARAASSSSLASYVRKVSTVNPLYAQLRDAAWNSMQANGGQLDPRALVSLERARQMPIQDRYVMVDAAAARLYMIENGQIVDSMKVIVGSAETPTPMLASTIYYATVNPYWNVMPELVRSLIAPNVLSQGIGYLERQGYEVKPTSAAEGPVDPAQIDWKAVAEGRQTIRVRQRPGPANSMGQVKIGFPNSEDIYLHDTPMKEKFELADRSISHGCVRLEDAERLSLWLMKGRDRLHETTEKEANLQLPTPVPIYVTYLTAQAQGGQLSFVDDTYGLDARRISQIASLR
ncbi:MAG: L,D-transpeptidase family protein [Pseudomonadota bacterium]